jgi:hypothetical protein
VLSGTRGLVEPQGAVTARRFSVIGIGGGGVQHDAQERAMHT